MSDQRTHARSHFGVRERETGRFNSKALISSEIVGSEQVLTALLKARVCESIDLYPLIGLTDSFFSSNRCTRKSAILLVEGSSGLISLREHQLVNTFHRASYTVLVDFLRADAMRTEALEENRFFRRASLITARRVDGTCLVTCEGRLFETADLELEVALGEDP